MAHPRYRSHVGIAIMGRQGWWFTWPAGSSYAQSHTPGTKAVHRHRYNQREYQHNTPGGHHDEGTPLAPELFNVEGHGLHSYRFAHAVWYVIVATVLSTSFQYERRRLFNSIRHATEYNRRRIVPKAARYTGLSPFAYYSILRLPSLAGRRYAIT